MPLNLSKLDIPRPERGFFSGAARQTKYLGLFNPCSSFASIRLLIHVPRGAA
jgi:hypothetical protein